MQSLKTGATLISIALKALWLILIVSSYGLDKLIQEPNHILNLLSSCSDLIFTLQPNLIMESEIHLFHSNCHHQIVFAKFNFSFFYPPPYKRTVSHYEKVNTELIRRAIDQFDWLRDLFNVNAHDEKVYFFNKTLINIIQNVIPQETIICDDRDLPWINKEIKKLMVEKNLAFKSHCCSNKNMSLFEKFEALQNQLNI